MRPGIIKGWIHVRATLWPIIPGCILGSGRGEVVTSLSRISQAGYGRITLTRSGNVRGRLIGRTGPWINDR